MGNGYPTRRHRTGRRVGAIALVVLAAVMLGALMLRPDHRAGPCAVAGGVAMLAEIPEASGLAVSRRHPGVIWTHNDSGHAATLFALDLGGAVRGRVAVPLRTRDWEDVSAGRCASHDCLYIADIGDNSLARRTIQIARVLEPALGDAQTPTPEIFTAAYEDGPHNAEALFIIGADLFIVTRDRRGAVYRATTVSPPGRTLTFRRVGELGLAAVTDAEASRDEQFFVVRTSHEAVLYRTADLMAGRFAPFLRIPIDGLREPQGEGVALDGTLLYLVSEGWRWNRAGRLLTLRCSMPD
jgi:hypothetical protein